MSVREKPQEPHCASVLQYKMLSHLKAQPALWLPFLVSVSGSSCQAQENFDDLRSREQWLRYSNWEGHQNRRFSTHEQNKAPESKASAVKAPPLPADPGARSVEPNNNFSIPGWALNSPKEFYRSPEIPLIPTFSSRLGPSYGAYYYGFRPGYYMAGSRSRLGPQILQTGPSPSSGNYYQPQMSDPSASGNYYAGGRPWQIELTK